MGEVYKTSGDVSKSPCFLLQQNTMFCLAFTVCALFFAHGALSTEPLIARQNSYYGRQADDGQSSALPINAQPPTLQQIYGNGQGTAQFMLNFADEPTRWDPYNNASEFRWREYNPAAGIPADNAYIELTNTGPYAKPYASKKAALLSAPFQSWIPLDLTITNETTLNTTPTPQNEGGLRWKGNVTIDDTERILLRFKCSCKILRAEKHPFPASLVSHSDDDPRLANCNVQLVPKDADFVTIIGVLITNKSVWAFAYGLFGTVKRRIGLRQSYNDIVDVGLEYNAVTKDNIFYINGVPVWHITDSLQAPPADGITKLDANDAIDDPNATLPPRTMPAYSFAFGTRKCLDESDPWDQTDKTRLVRILSGPVYPSSTVFYDNDDLRSNNLWGQTVKMTLYKVLIETANATTTTGTDGTQLPYYNTGGGGMSGGSSYG